MSNNIDKVLCLAESGKKFIFDLDNTLIDENIWLEHAYEKIASIAFPRDFEKALNAFSFLKKAFKDEGRKNLLDKFKSEFPESEGEIQDWLIAMRNLKIRAGIPIDFFKKEILLRHPKSCIAILTNGSPEQQKNKYLQISPFELVEKIMLFCANEFKPKPSPIGLIKVLEKFSLEPMEVVFIGDSEEDFECAASANVEFMRWEFGKK